MNGTIVANANGPDEAVIVGHRRGQAALRQDMLLDLLHAISHKNEAGLQFADVLASAFYRGVALDNKDRQCNPEFAQMLRERIYAPNKADFLGNGIKTMPALPTAADVVAALGSLADAVAGGDLTPDEGASVATILETKRRAIETVELESRVAALERK